MNSISLQVILISARQVLLCKLWLCISYKACLCLNMKSYPTWFIMMWSKMPCFEFFTINLVGYFEALNPWGKYINLESRKYFYTPYIFVWYIYLFCLFTSIFSSKNVYVGNDIVLHRMCFAQDIKVKKIMCFFFCEIY